MSDSASLPFDLPHDRKLDSAVQPGFDSSAGLSTPAPAPSRRFRSSRFSRVSDPVAAHDRRPLLNGGNLALLPGFVAIAFYGLTHLKDMGHFFAPGHTGLTSNSGADFPFWLPATLAIGAALGLSVAAFVFLRKRAQWGQPASVTNAEATAAQDSVSASQAARPLAKRTPFGPVLRFSGKHRAAERAAALAQAEEPTPVDPFSSGSPRRMRHESARTLPADVRFRRDLRRQLDRKHGPGRTVLPPAVAAAVSAQLPPAQPRLVTDSHR